MFNGIHRHAFDLIELNGEDLRREPIERRKLRLAQLLPRAAAGIRLNGYIEGEDAVQNCLAINFPP